MSFVTDTWRQLVRRRLWPVALLLLAAIAAVPLLLAKDPEPTAVPPAPAADSGTKLAVDTSDPVVKVASADGARRRHVLGASKDPFEPAPAKKVKKSKGSAESSATPTATSSPDSGSPSSPSAGGGSAAPDSTSVSGPAPTVVTPPKPKKKVYPAGTLIVRFNGAKKHIAPLEALPSTDEPAIVYTGTTDGGKAAVFMLDSSIVAQGDGDCQPSPEECQTLVLRKGDTEFFDYKSDDAAAGSGTAATTGDGNGFELDLLDVVRSKKASTSRKLAKASAGGARRYRSDAHKGALKRLVKARRSAPNAESAFVGGR
jgi:hypothetical protein